MVKSINQLLGFHTAPPPTRARVTRAPKLMPRPGPEHRGGPVVPFGKYFVNFLLEPWTVGEIVIADPRYAAFLLSIPKVRADRTLYRSLREHLMLVFEAELQLEAEDAAELAAIGSQMNVEHAARRSSWPHPDELA